MFESIPGKDAYHRLLYFYSIPVSTCAYRHLSRKNICTPTSDGMEQGDPKKVKEYCRKLIEVCAPGGGFILAGGAWVNEGNPDNLRAMMEAAKEYGKY